MKYDILIEHILGNAKSYIKAYEQKDNLDQEEKGILLGLWMDLDSINNQLLIENLETKHNIKEIMNKLETLRNK